MRFKQTKPQHVSKKEEEVSRATSVISPENSSLLVPTDWEEGGQDCVDGDVDMAAFSQVPHTTRIFTEVPLVKLNGHHAVDKVMDMGPMLEAYTTYTEDSEMRPGVEPEEEEEELAESATASPENSPAPSPAVAGTENDVIIQGRRPIFSESEESNIAMRLKQWKDQGMKYTRLDVVKMASEYAIHLGKRPQGRPLTVKWFRSFLTRHPECYIRKSRRVKTERPERQHFNQLDAILSRHGMKESPHCIFSLVELPLNVLKNGAEVSAMIDSIGPQDLSMNGKSLFGSNGTAKSHHRKFSFLGKVPSSILFCGSAAGQALPPFLIFSGKTLDKTVLAGATPGAGGIACPAGRATSDVLVSFLREHFLTQAPGRAGDTLVLLLDANLGRCLSQAALDLGSAFKVVFVTGQASLNPQLHPMAVGCCNTFHRELCFELQKPHYTSETPAISAASICEFLCRLYHRNMSAENLHASFRKAGIYPFNPSTCRKRYGSMAPALLLSPTSLITPTLGDGIGGSSSAISCSNGSEPQEMPSDLSIKSRRRSLGNADNPDNSSSIVDEISP
ncbi:kinase d interacting substrate of 220 kda [Plakobranchus ocellatus]|uniref:Kinase d interacting substrate of 220 kDa n=1 Tax=Plakobranchus ocellatus TaxID=259542 RepID=A0AAV3XUY7_9GAST|nr:kinase d interacting substrate of 220 kda [Plakobranchus ocellatus]